MTLTDVARFGLIVALGLLAVITFLFAATIIGLMWAESSDCNCLHYPIGIYVLGLFGLLLLASLIIEIFDATTVSWFEDWAENRREVLVAAGIFLIVLIWLWI
jgi:hypothetical protein